MARLRSSQWYMLGFVALVSAIAGFGTAMLILKLTSLDTCTTPCTSEPFPLLFCLSASIASLVASPFFWWLFMFHFKHHTIWWGVLAEVVGSVVAHPFTWLFLILFSLPWGGSSFVQNQDANGAIFLFLPFVTLISLLTVGWFTAFIGALLGAYFFLVQRLFHIQDVQDTLSTSTSASQDLSPAAAPVNQTEVPSASDKRKLLYLLAMMRTPWGIVAGVATVLLLLGSGWLIADAIRVPGGYPVAPSTTVTTSDTSCQCQQSQPSSSTSSSAASSVTPSYLATTHVAATENTPRL